MPKVKPPAIQTSNEVRRRLRQVMELHFDPDLGAPYWIDRAKAFAFDPRDHVRDLPDLSLLGNMTPEDLSARPLLDYIPRRFHNQLDQFIVGQTGGTTGGGVWTAYRADEFHEAFIQPFISAADYVGFPRAEAWLYIGPSGPHLIGKAAPQLARAMGSADPFSVDFDPRWARKMPEGTLASRRYLDHVVEQAMAVIDTQPIGVLFTTPRVLAALAQVMTQTQRHRIRAVHYGGMALDADQLLAFQDDVFPYALHLSGYGNTLLGCALELCASRQRQLDYYPHGPRLIYEVDALPESRGCVLATRLDMSMLIVRLVERDEAELITPDPDMPEGFILQGLRDPRPPAAKESHLKIGLY